MPDYRFAPERIFAALHRESVRYVLIGALAATLHGSPLRTNDADICPARDDENLGRLASVLDDLGARLRTLTDPDGVPFVIEAATLRDMQLCMLITRFGDLDISFEPSGTRGYADLVRDAIVYEIDGIPVKVASLLDIIRSKEAAGRAKDRAHLPLLREMLERWGEHP